MKEKINKWLSLTILRSRTISAIIVGLGALVLKFFGIDLDLGAIIEAADGIQLSELVYTISGIAAIYFRRNIRTDLTTPGVGGAPENNG